MSGLFSFLNFTLSPLPFKNWITPFHYPSPLSYGLSQELWNSNCPKKRNATGLPDLNQNIW
jgi:hypothetical protein